MKNNREEVWLTWGIPLTSSSVFHFNIQEMRKFSRAAAAFFTFIVLVVNVESRFLRSNASELVSDGVDGDKASSYLFLKGVELESSESEKECEQMYGFLPCSTSIYGHLFLIFVYEYLVFHGESYLAAGGKQIFELLGPGVFGASAFDILGALPESLLLLASGLSGNKETAQEYATTGVGLLAGSSILLLTVVWGTCVIIGKQKFEPDSGAFNFLNSFAGLKSLLTGSGITTNFETTQMARIMVLSVIPPMIMQIPNIFHFSSGPRNLTFLIALLITIFFLILYLLYQIFEPHIHKIIRLEYVEHDHLILKIVQHVPKHTLQSILTENGTPNDSAIMRLFNVIDKNGDGEISASELKELLLRTRLTETKTNDENEVEQVFKIFDQNGDKRISKEEFVNGFKTWLDQTKHALDKKYLSRQKQTNIYQVVKPWIEKKRSEREMRKHVKSELLKQVKSDVVDSLSTKEGTADEPAIQRLFEKIDSNKDHRISQSELKELIMSIKPGMNPEDVEEALGKITQELDIDQDNEISEEEFVAVLKKWLHPSPSHSPLALSVSQEEIHPIWESVEKVVEENHNKGLVAWLKAIMNVVVGIAMVSVLAEPLIESVQNFSRSAGISSFFVSFILVPLAINAREASMAFREAGHKKKYNTSETIYEIYDAVFMNNTLGFFAIAILIYVREVSWEFSAEVLVVAIVCAIIGLAASFFSKFPLWTSFCAYLLYPLALILAYVLTHVVHYG
ncbi:hypothetical protein L6164_022633 [Bauhinia variegata]|uniref:Uncharacterized protein n=1 Tax=Bauhinia variegata TaxID=167791 RepID=A0ACB9MHP3_BAUVA|nr:hypothetical protein L6164_022633 [Bauhinia variegata]